MSKANILLFPFLWAEQKQDKACELSDQSQSIGLTFPLTFTCILSVNCFNTIIEQLLAFRRLSRQSFKTSLWMNEEANISNFFYFWIVSASYSVSFGPSHWSRLALLLPKLLLYACIKFTLFNTGIWIWSNSVISNIEV